MARVLVVDDDADLRQVLRRALERAGHTVCEAEDGCDVVRRCRESRAEVVLLDVFMPHRDGIESIQELRDSDPDTRVIAMSGGGARLNFEPLRVAVALGVDGALLKPFSMGTLVDAVAAVLGAGDGR